MPGLTRADLAGSFYALMETRYGLRLAGERSRIDARNCSREEATKLGVAKGAAALVVAGAGYTDTDEGIWYQILLYRGDRYHLENQVQLGGQNHSTQFKRKDEGFQ